VVATLPAGSPLASSRPREHVKAAGLTGTSPASRLECYRTRWPEV